MSIRVSKKIRFEFSSLGTDIEIQFWIKDEKKLQICGEFFQQIEKIYSNAMDTFSRFDVKSELSILNASLNTQTHCSEWMKVIALRSVEYYNKSGGLFDPRIIDILEKTGYVVDFQSNNFLDTILDLSVDEKNFQVSLEKDLLIENDSIIFKRRMDFSGIVKGFVTDEVAKYLRLNEIEDFLVDSGGDIYASGQDGSDSWYIGLEGIPEEKLLIRLNKEGIATSGINRRKWEVQGKRVHHIINPHVAGEFSFEFKSVTVVANSTEEADVWAKVLFLKGGLEGKEIAEKNNIKCIFLDYHGVAWISSAMKSNL